MTTNIKKHPERRKHKRFPIVTSAVKTISIDLPMLHIKDPLPGIMGNLSAGGMTIATFIPIPVGTDLELSMELPEFSADNLKGKVVRVDNKEGSCLISIVFTKIDKKTKGRINKIAGDYR